MTSVIDPRMAERRREVTQNNMVAAVRSLAKWLLLVALAGALAWLVRSPVLAVKYIYLTGASQSRAAEILDEVNVSVGRPILFVRSGRAETALEEDVWIGSASVWIELPGTVRVEIEERLGVAWLTTAEGWALLSGDGKILTVKEAPAGDEPTMQMVAGEPAGDIYVTGSLEFLESLPATLLAGVSVWKSDGELWAEVAGFPVRLGRPFELAAKAAAVSALIAHGQQTGATLTVVAPHNPAVTPYASITAATLPTAQP
jgi:cell division protein FtsQ